MEQKNEFMFVFRLEPNPNFQLTPEQLEEMGQTWGAFFGGIAGQGKMVITHKLGYEGKLIASDKSVTDGIYISDGKTISGNLIVNADTLEEVTQMALTCPILQMGGTIEVRSIEPM
jgi:hypothetical protein